MYSMCPLSSTRSCSILDFSFLEVRVTAGNLSQAQASRSEEIFIWPLGIVRFGFPFTLAFPLMNQVAFLLRSSLARSMRDCWYLPYLLSGRSRYHSQRIDTSSHAVWRAYHHGSKLCSRFVSPKLSCFVSWKHEKTYRNFAQLSQS